MIKIWYHQIFKWLFIIFLVWKTVRNEIQLKLISKGGYVIYTLTDGERVDKILDGKPSYASFYTDDDGRKWSYLNKENYKN